MTRSRGSTGDCYDNALAESFVDSFKTELISDRVWRTHDQAELAIVEWVGWFNHARLHSSLGDIPPVEYEQLHAGRIAAQSADQPDGSVATTPAAAANGLTTPALREDEYGVMSADAGHGNDRHARADRLAYEAHPPAEDWLGPSRARSVAAATRLPIRPSIPPLD